MSTNAHFRNEEGSQQLVREVKKRKVLLKNNATPYRSFMFVQVIQRFPDSSVKRRTDKTQRASWN